jgi:hypothetical protein
VERPLVRGGLETVSLKELEEHMLQSRPTIKDLEIDFSNYGEPESYLKGYNDATKRMINFLREKGVEEE